jgi:hypothetical protein
MHRLAVLVAVCLLIVGAQARAADVTLAWDTNAEPDLAGYRLYYGTASGHYQFVIDVGKTTTYTVSGLAIGTYFFAITAYNRSGLESGYSNEVSKDISAAATFYFPHSVNWTAGGVGPETAAAGATVTNLDTLPVTVTFTAYGMNGLLVSGANINNPVTMVLDPGEQVAFVDSELFGSGLLFDDPIAYVEIASSSSRITAALISYADSELFGPGLLFDDPIAYVEITSSSSRITATLISYDGNGAIPDAAPVAVTFTTYIFPEVKDGDPAWLGVANSNPVSAAALFQLIGADGKVLRSTVRIIDAQGTFIADTMAEVFPGAELSGSEYIRVIAGQGVVPCQLLSRTSQYVQVLDGQPVSDGATALYSPQYVVGGPWHTTLSVVNLDQGKGTVSFQLFSDDGVELGPLQTQAIAPQGKVWVPDLWDLVVNDSGIAQGYVRITSDGVKLTGSVLFSYKELNGFTTALPLLSVLTRSVLYSVSSQDLASYTGIAIVNPGDEILSGSLEVYDQDGILLANPFPLNIPARQRFKGILTDCFPNLASTSTAYLKIKADRDFASYAICGTRILTSLMWIPAQIVR